VSALRDHAVAGLWGFAEATAFFVVPDVWLSAVALRNLPRGLTGAASATAGALVGGAVGGVLDGYMMNKIGEQALKEFPRSAANIANES